MTNFYSTSGRGCTLPSLKPVESQACCWLRQNCAVCSFKTNSIPIISYLLNGSYSHDFRTSVSGPANEFIVLIIMPRSHGWEIWSVKYSLILQRSWQTPLTLSITQSPHIIDLVSHCFELKVLVFSCEETYFALFFSRQRGLPEPCPCVKGFAGYPVYAYLKIKRKVRVLMIWKAWSISNRVYSQALTSKPSLCFS